MHEQKSKELLQNKNPVQSMAFMHEPVQPYFVFYLSFATDNHGKISPKLMKTGYWLYSI